MFIYVVRERRRFSSAAMNCPDGHGLCFSTAANVDSLPGFFLGQACVSNMSAAVGLYAFGRVAYQCAIFCKDTYIAGKQLL